MRNVDEMIKKAQNLGSHEGFELEEAEAIRVRAAEADNKIMPYKLIIDSYDFGYAVCRRSNEAEIRAVCNFLESVENELKHEIESGKGKLGEALLQTMAARKIVEKGCFETY